VMGDISVDVFNMAIALMYKIERVYGCNPQIIVNKERVGFNVGGLEAGHIRVGEDGDIHVIYYAPADRRWGLCFLEKVFNCLVRRFWSHILRNNENLYLWLGLCGLVIVLF